MSRWLWVKFVVSAGLLWLLLQHVGATGVLARIGAVNPGLAALAIIVLLFQLWLGAFRWHSVTRAFEVPTPAFVLWRHLLVAQFCSQLLPASVGGDVIRTWLLQRQGILLRTAILITLADRLVGVAALLMLMGIALALPQAMLIDPSARFALKILIAGGTLFFIVNLCIGSLPEVWMSGTRICRIGRDLSRGLRAMFANGWRAFEVSAVSVAIHSISVLSIWLLARALGVAVSPWILAVTIPLALFVTMLPISIGGWGIREGVLVGLLRTYDVPADGAMAISVLFGAALAAASLPGAFVWLASSTPVNKMKMDVENAYDSL